MFVAVKLDDEINILDFIQKKILSFFSKRLIVRPVFVAFLARVEKFAFFATVVAVVVAAVVVVVFLNVLLKS